MKNVNKQIKVCMPTMEFSTTENSSIQNFSGLLKATHINNIYVTAGLKRKRKQKIMFWDLS